MKTRNPLSNLFSAFTVGIPVLIVLFGQLLFGVGCASRTSSLVTGRVTLRNGTNLVEVIQPKDVTINSLTLNPQGVLSLQGYRSVADEAALKSNEAQAAMMFQFMNKISDLTQSLANVAAKASGSPVVPFHPGQGQEPAPLPFPTGPSGSVAPIPLINGVAPFGGGPNMAAPVPGATLPPVPPSPAPR